MNNSTVNCLSQPVPSLGSGQIAKANPASYKSNRSFLPYALEPLRSTSAVHQLLLFTQGEGWVTTGTQRNRIVSPVLLFLPPEHVFTCNKTSKQPFGYQYTITCDDWQQNQAVWNDFPFFQRMQYWELALLTEQAAGFSQLFQKIETERLHDHPQKDVLIRLYLHILLIEASRILPLVAKEDDFHAPHANGRLIKRFTQLLDHYFTDEIKPDKFNPRSVSDYADALSVHPNHLNDVVKNATGKTPGDHIRDRIVRQAIVLIQHSDLSISEIAYRLHFKDPSYFSRFFKKYTQQAPGDFKK